MAKRVAVLVLCAALLDCADAFAPALAVRPSLSLKSPSVSTMRRPETARATRAVSLSMQEEKAAGFVLSPWLRFDTRGGVLVWTMIGIVLPFLLYNPLAELIGDEFQAGRLISGLYLVGVCFFWTFSYVFRVGTKDMTYSKQLKAYEDAVIAKRFEELQEDEVDALMNALDDPNPKIPGVDPDAPKIRGSGWRPDQY